MKSLTILGVLALAMLLMIPGAVSAADVSVSGSVVDEDLTVTAISPNVGAGAYFFANEPNVISVTVTNNGGLDAEASTVEVVVGTDTYTAAVPAITAGGSQTVTVTDTVSRTYASGPVSVTATADSAGVIAESDETNNAMTSDLTIYYNGYKGKRYTDGSDIVTYKSFNQRGDVVYSMGDSYYLSASTYPTWTTYEVEWTAADLPIPEDATITEARLYIPYTWDKGPIFPTYSTVEFNDDTVAIDAIYTDIKGFGTSTNYPYGMTAYDVTDSFEKGGNAATLTNTYSTGGQVSIRGMILVVVYADTSETEKQIIINEEFDMLYGGSSYGTTPEEATAYAPFGDLDTSDVNSATLITFAPGAGPTEGELLFNGQTWTNVWNFVGTTQIGLNEQDVTSYLQATDNEAGFQSSADWMEASNAILVLEQTEAAVTADFTPATQVSGDKPFTVNFDSSASTGYITSYAWTFEGAEGTDYQFVDATSATSANPHVEYLTRGTYDVSLTVTGVGSSDTETKEDLLVVKEPAPVVDFTIDPASGTEPLPVSFDATNTGGAVDTWTWEYKLNGGSTWTMFGSNNDEATFTFEDAGTYDIRLTAAGPDYSDVETKENAVSVGASSITVEVSHASIDFGTMSAGVSEEGATTVSVNVEGGTPWEVIASATNSGYMSTGTVNLADMFQVSNDGKVNYYTLDESLTFLTGAAGVDGSQVADVLQTIQSSDAPGVYSITLTFTGTMA